METETSRIVFNPNAVRTIAIDVGQSIGQGIVNRLLLSIGLGGLLIIGSIWLFGLNPKDSTDGPDGRSGLILSVDNLTGCEYLSNPRGGITPRLGYSGQHLGCK